MAAPCSKQCLSQRILCSAPALMESFVTLDGIQELLPKHLEGSRAATSLTHRDPHVFFTKVDVMNLKKGDPFFGKTETLTILGCNIKL